ncbi:MAG: hypothetical protein HOV81_31365 [Kofleriaceae bacterium]|nr:hypothetical protein [Kofleriaceae bacterium]
MSNGNAPPATPGKQSASAGLPGGQATATTSRAGATLTGGPLPPELQAHIGETFLDGGSYVWRLEPDGAFRCVAQPPSATTSSVGARVTQAARADLWATLCAIAIEALAPEAKPDSETAPAEGAEDGAAEEGGGFSLEGFLAGLFAAGSTLVDVGSQVADLVTDTLDAVTGAIGSLLGVGGDGSAEPVEAPAPQPSEGGGSGGATEDVREEEGGDAPADAPAANPATPFIVGGYPSSKEAGGKPNFSGAEVNDDAGIPKNHGGVHLTPPIVRTAKILAEYVPAGTLITSGWRTDEDQAYIIWDYAGRAAGRGKHNGMLVDNDLWKTKPKAEEYNNPIAWVGESDHRSGLAMDLAGASLSDIEAAVEKCKAERPEAKIRYIIHEPKCIHVAVDE